MTLFASGFSIDKIATTDEVELRVVQQLLIAGTRFQVFMPEEIGFSGINRETLEGLVVSLQTGKFCAYPVLELMTGKFFLGFGGAINFKKERPFWDMYIDENKAANQQAFQAWLRSTFGYQFIGLEQITYSELRALLQV